MGRGRWNGVFDGIDAERITTVAIENESKPFAGVLPDDTLLTFATGPGDDKLVFVFRQDYHKHWQVVAELTDY